MKKLAILLTLIFPIFVLSSCDDDFEEVTEVYLSAVLTPTSTSASVSTSDGFTITFTWTNANHATQYLLEIYQFDSSTGPSKLADVTDSMIASTTPVSITVEASDGSTTSYVYESEPDAYYYARVKGQNTDDANQDDSGWAVFPYPIETYAVKDALPSFEVTNRTSSAITVAWTLADGDEEGISEVRVTPDPDGGDSYKAYSVTEGSNSLTIDGLSASTMYTLKANYYSATRYSITAWTKPSTDGYTTVTDTASFHQAITDQASKILVAYSDTPYPMGSIAVTTDVTIIGESLADGTQPTIIGNVAPAGNVQNIRIEDLTFDGSSFTGSAYNYNHLIGYSEAPTAKVQSIEVVNCYLYHFKRGLLYFGTGQANTNGFGNILFDSVYCEDVSGDGGEAIGFRGTSGVTYSTIDNITIQNSTFTDGMREFIRVDASYPLTKVTITNNTFNNLCTMSGSNGILYFQNTIGEFNLTNNLFLNMTSESCQNGSKYFIGNVLFNTSASTPNTVSSYTVNNNYWYNLCGSEWNESLSYSFFNSYFTQSIATNGGAILTEDPCYNSERGIFNVTNTTVSAASVGDPRYLIDYVVPEDAELEPVEYGYVWDLTDSGTFDATVEETHVRGNLQFIVTSNPINMVDEGQEFTAAATFNNNGTPNDCAIKFLVNQPGAVVLSAVNDGNINNHITVAYGPSNGTSITGVAGAAYAGASDVKASMQDIVEGEETAVYIYACGPIILSELSWTKGVVQLETPVPALSAATTTGEDVTLSWGTVNGAGSYEVTCTGPYTDSEATVTSVSGTSMTLSGLDFGNYTYTVKAISSNTNDYTDSEVSESVTLGVREAVETLGTSKTYTWGAEDFAFLATVFGENENVTESFAYNGMYYLAESSIRFGVDENAVDANSQHSNRVYLGGGGNTTKRALVLHVGGSGTLTVEANSSGSAGRIIQYQVGTGGDVTDLLTVNSSADPAVIGSAAITANAGDAIYIYSKSSGQNIYNVTWEPSGASESTGIPSDDEAIEETYIVTTDDFKANEGNKWATVAAGETLTVDKVTYAAKSDKAMDFDQSGGRWKFGGASEVGEDGIPTGRYVSFKITTPGTITHKVISGSSSDAARAFGVLLVTVENGQNVVTTLYHDYSATSSSADAIETAVTADHLANTTQTATVYVYTDANCNLYGIGYTPAE